LIEYFTTISSIESGIKWLKKNIENIKIRNTVTNTVINTQLFYMALIFHFSFESNAKMVTNFFSLKIHSNEAIFNKEYPGFDNDLSDVYPWISFDPETHPNMFVLIKRKDFKPNVGITRRIS